MLGVWLIVSALFAVAAIMGSVAAYLDNERPTSAVMVIVALTTWLWPITVPLVVIFLITNLTFFVLEELTDYERPEWWPLESWQ